MTDDCAFNGPMARLIKGGRHLDIFDYETNEDGTMLIDHEMEYYGDTYGVFHKYDDIFPLKKCMLGGVVLTCPRNPLKFLEITYGKDVVIPKYRCKNSKWV